LATLTPLALLRLQWVPGNVLIAVFRMGGGTRLHLLLSNVEVMMTDPVAFQLGRLTIRWYGVMVALGFLAAFQLVQHRGKRRGFGAGPAGDLTFVLMLGGLIGARVLYVMQNWSTEFSGRWLEALRIDHGGLVFYGGFIGAAIAGGAMCRFRKWRFADAADLVAPALAIGHALGRIGCLINGCCFGHPWQAGLAVRYPVSSGVLDVHIHKGLLGAAATAALPVFPVQAVAAAANLALCGLLLCIEPRMRRSGQLFACYLVLYSCTRFAIEFLRGDYIHRVGVFTPAQVICVALFPIGLAWLLWAVRGSPKETAGQGRPEQRPDDE